MIFPVRVDPAIKAPHYAARNHFLTPGHPLAIDPCPICGHWLGEGPLALVFVGRFPGGRPDWSAASIAIHESCAAEEEGQ